MVRAKFVCEGKEDNPENPKQGFVKLRAVYSGSPENEEFFKLTPAATISLATVNEHAYAEFEIGKEYYVDFTEAAQN